MSASTQAERKVRIAGVVKSTEVGICRGRGKVKHHIKQKLWFHKYDESFMIYHLRTEKLSEKYILKRFYSCVNIIECTDTNTAYYTHGLYAIAYCY